MGEKWAYDPNNVISNLRMKNKSKPFLQHWNVDLEMAVNKRKWEEVLKVFLMDAKEAKQEP